MFNIQSTLLKKKTGGKGQLRLVTKTHIQELFLNYMTNPESSLLDKRKPQNSGKLDQLKEKLENRCL
jgi:hypothetical protein